MEVETFFCEACLEDKTKAQRSPDGRYCLGCYQFLLKEAKLDSSSHHSGGWIPRPAPEGSHRASAEPVGWVPGCNKNQTHHNSRGRPRAGISVEKVLKMQAQGVGVRGIARELGVSHMTIARLLKDRLNKEKNPA